MAIIDISTGKKKTLLDPALLEAAMSGDWSKVRGQLTGNTPEAIFGQNYSDAELPYTEDVDDKLDSIHLTIVR